MLFAIQSFQSNMPKPVNSCKISMVMDTAEQIRIVFHGFLHLSSSEDFIGYVYPPVLNYWSRGCYYRFCRCRQFHTGQESVIEKGYQVDDSDDWVELTMTG